jgi:hypothetical protein
MLLSVSSNLLPTKGFANANLIMFQGFLIYLFYKVFVILRARYQPVIFFLSFLIPFAFLIHLLVTQ